jgi:hypothetical protein
MDFISAKDARQVFDLLECSRLTDFPEGLTATMGLNLASCTAKKMSMGRLARGI